MKKRLISLFQYTLFLGAGLFLVWWQLKSMTPEQSLVFREAFHQANYWLAIPVVIISLLSHLSRAMRWKILMEPLGFNPRLSNAFGVTMIGYLANAAIPRFGELLKCTLLSRYEKLKFDKLVGTIIVERSFDLLCFMLFIALTVLIQFQTVSAYAAQKVKLIFLNPEVSPLTRILVAVGTISAVVLLVRYIFRRFPEHRLVLRIRHFISGLLEGFQSILRLKKRGAFLAHTLIIWTCYHLQIYIGFQAMAGTSHLTIKAACSVLTLASLAMIATPGGIGSFPIFVQETLQVYAIPESLGTAFGWLMWGISTGIVILGGLAALLILPYLNKTKSA